MNEKMPWHTSLILTLFVVMVAFGFALAVMEMVSGGALW